MKLQKAWRGKISRKRAMTQRQFMLEEKRRNEAYLKQANDTKRRHLAAILIQRAWRRRRFRKNELARIQVRNMKRRQVQQEEFDQRKKLFRETYLVKKIQKWWRARREARLRGTAVTNPFKSPLSFSKTLSKADQTIKM